ncbi:hypothetical protein F7725_011079 [Dissostichus mawsoni]|uniref:Rho GTPase-activating protein 12-like n=1 Tax=Dissostichus mawsoni TaxID=36200 RepID=A0A7J5ZC10_DISMA|nr:hypothetical protein F7725_011079 [Dissostichus mawsoni]
MAELPIAPGEVYIEVEYDYEYKSKDRLITIHQGECFMLVKKATRTGGSSHAPSQNPSSSCYCPRKPNSTKRGVLWVKPISLELGPADSLHRHESNYRRSPSAHTASSGNFSPPTQRRNSSNHHGPPTTPTDHDRALADILHHGGAHLPAQREKSSTLPRTRARSPDMERSPLDVDHRTDSAGEERRTNDSESGDELSSSSTELLQSEREFVNRQRLLLCFSAPSVSPRLHHPPSAAGRLQDSMYPDESETTVSSSGHGRSESPVYTNLQELKITQSSLPPAPSSSPLHTTPLSLSPSFLPFLSLSIGRLQPLSSEDFSTYSSQSDSQYGSPPRGWSEEMDEYGHTLYVSDHTNEKLNHSLPLPGDAPKSRSLDRRSAEPIVLTKWRHSAYVQDPNDKRLIKTRRFRAGSARQHPYKHQDAPLSPKPSTPDSDSCPSSPSPLPLLPSEKCGVLNVTKITEHGKKEELDFLLDGAARILAAVHQKPRGRDQLVRGGQSKPEFTVDLRGGSVEWASKDKSSKKHVIEVKTRRGTELLIQSDNEGLMSDWYRALLDTISTHESDEAIEEDMPESPGAEKEQRDSKKGRAMKTSSSMDASDNKKTRHKLKKFLTRRPTLQAVRDKGYIEDQVFGCSLSTLCQRENGSVPIFVTMCIDHVENNGLCVDGLYRVSGNLAIIQKLRFAINHDERVNLSDSKWEDFHVITGALKMYFRELPEPLFTYALFHDFISAIKSPDYKQRVQSIKDLVRQLPVCNHDTMQTLFKHLRNVAIVYGPTLLRPEQETWNIAVHMVYQNQIVELILLEYENIFGR